MLIGEGLAWSKLCRENFAIVLLAAMYGMAFGLILHMSHDSRDTETIAWVREAATGLASAFFALMQSKRAASGEPAATTTTTTTVRAEGGPPIPPVTPVIVETPKPEAK